MHIGVVQSSDGQKEREAIRGDRKREPRLGRALSVHGIREMGEAIHDHVEAKFEE